MSNSKISTTKNVLSEKHFKFGEKKIFLKKAEIIVYNSRFHCTEIKIYCNYVQIYTIYMYKCIIQRLTVFSFTFLRE